MYELEADAYFDSAHFLAGYHGKCENLHGHRWRLSVAIERESLRPSGDVRDMVCDFGDFKHAVRSLADEFDHTFLIEEGSLQPATIKALEMEEFSLKMLPFRTTAENLAKHFYDRLVADGWNVCRVEVDETPNNRAIYRP